MQAVSSSGGPQIVLPSSDVDRWIEELAETPSPECGLYGLVCSVTDYCGVIAPWGRPILVFGDEPADLYWFPDIGDGLFARWIASESLEAFADFVSEQSNSLDWQEATEWEVIDSWLTVMDSCAVPTDGSSRLQIELRTGWATLHSRYAACASNACVLHRIEYKR